MKEKAFLRILRNSGISVSLATMAFVAGVAVFAVASRPVPAVAEDTPSGETVLVAGVKSWFDGVHTVSAFHATLPEGMTVPRGARFIWDLGNGQVAQGSDPLAVFLEPGPFLVRVDMEDASGRVIASGSSRLKPFPSPLSLAAGPAGSVRAGTTLRPRTRVSAASGNARQQHILDREDARLTGAGPRNQPSPLGTGTAKDQDGPALYLNVQAPGAMFAMEGDVVSFTGEGDQDDWMTFRENSGIHRVWEARKAGYFRVLTDTGRDYRIFVSPFPSVHVDRPDMDWYLTQWNTKTTSNCGPTVTAMAVRWARGADLDVVTVRGLMGWHGSGAISLEDMKGVLDRYRVDWKVKVLESPEDIFRTLDEGHLLAVTYDMSGVKKSDDPVHELTGQHYTDHGGHYLALKGYSRDRKYIIVYDPIPSDWGWNALRYGDGISMIGRNRYFPVDELWKALRSRHGLEILPS